jgi:hypothetical protein
VIYLCCSDLRRTLVQGNANFNGIDFLEVLDDPSTPLDQVQRTLFVHFVNPVTTAIGPNNVRVEGGERIQGIHVSSVGPGDDADVLAVRVDRSGDFSTYTLRLVADASDPASEAPPPGIDPALAAVDFSFKAGCDTHVDCLVAPACPAEAPDEPLIDYLAKDYASFRQVVGDRMSAILPGWTERNPADVGVMLTEVLAHLGDYLSYEQDAIATEAYLGTAIRRTSVRRHARLVDYFMHDGCNARVWVQLQVGSDLVGPNAVAAGTRLLTQVPGLETHVAPGSREWLDALDAGAVVFEVMPGTGDRLLVDHNRLRFYTWGSERCCLPAGATSATLLGAHPGLWIGDVMIFQEVLGPETLRAQDADPTHRAAVRLTRVAVTQDPVTAAPVTEIAWGAEDALPLPFTVSRSDLTGSHDVSIALGNVVLADHGRKIDAPEPLGTPGAPSLSIASGPPPDPCRPASRTAVPVRFAPRLQGRPLTQAAPRADAGASAASAFRWKLADVLPDIFVSGPEPTLWHPQRDLIGSGPTVQDFVVEVENDGSASLRFGDGIRFGAEPKEGSQYRATYRVGSGAAGNVGWESIAHVVGGDPAISRVWNPLPASGGVDPENLEEVRQRAPFAFQLEQQRAVTAADYAAFATRYPDPNAPDVLQAEATFRWTGSWYTVFVTPDRAGGEPVDDGFRKALRRALEPYRMVGHDLEVEAPISVPLELDMTVCVSDDHFRGDVQSALLGIFNNRALPDGRLGLFHPDRFRFGQTVYLSPFVAAAQGVDGVQSVRVDTFQRWGVAGSQALDAGALTLHALEIARLDADPGFPDRGVFVLNLEGGK